MEDREIIDLFRQRPEEALSACSRLYGRYCRKIAENILHSPEDAHECVNETWLKAWNAIPPARPARLKAYLGRICRNIALDRYAAAHTQKRGGGAVEIALEELAEPCIRLSIAFWSRASVRVSTLLVASSKINIAGSAKIARAMFRSCFVLAIYYQPLHLTPYRSRRARPG